MTYKRAWTLWKLKRVWLFVCAVVTVECEEDIEQHFQRSLGKDYTKCIGKPTNHDADLSSNHVAAMPALAPLPTNGHAEIEGWKARQRIKRH